MNNLLNEEKLSTYILERLKIAEAIYTINKEAKRQRDIHVELSSRIYGNRHEEDSYSDYREEDDYEEDEGYGHWFMRSRRYRPRCGTPLQHYHLHNAKNEKKALYRLKDNAIAKLQEKFNIQPQWHHYFSLDNKCRDIYVVWTFAFHINSCNTTTLLGTIDQIMEADKRRSMSLPRAIQLLQEFVCN